MTIFEDTESKEVSPTEYGRRISSFCGYLITFRAAISEEMQRFLTFISFWRQFINLMRLKK
jgi:hypothetical protein